MCVVRRMSFLEPNTLLCQNMSDQNDVSLEMDIYMIHIHFVRFKMKLIWS